MGHKSQLHHEKYQNRTLNKIIFFILAAHCIQDKKRNFQKLPRNILLVFGAYNIDDPYEDGVVSIVPLEVIMHPLWNPSTIRYDADIAALVLEEDLPYTKYIRPVCLPSFEMTAVEGYVSGWGSSSIDKKIENIPKQIKVPIKTNEQCFLEKDEDIQLTRIASKTTFCAGGRNSQGPCRGDSGGGLVIRNGDQFFLKGLVSASLINNQSFCDVENYALYTNVIIFTDWIENPSEDYSATLYARTSSQTCGVMSGSTSLIVGGSLATREMFPWVVLLDTGKYNSTGTLVSDRHIAVKAMNVLYYDSKTDDDAVVPFNRFKMYFGIENRDKTNVPGALRLEGSSHISQILIHPTLVDPNAGNIAVIVLKNPIARSSYVSPICLPQSPLIISESQGKSAYLVGWGWDETGTSSKTKKYATLKIRNEKDCKTEWNDELQAVGSAKFFCAGGDGVQGPGYREGPLYMKRNNQWFLTGIFSKRRIHDRSNPDLSQSAFFEDVGQYYKWINEIIER